VDWVTIAVFGRTSEWFGACQKLLFYGVDCRMGRSDSPLHTELVCNDPDGVSLQVRRAEAVRGTDILRVLRDAGGRTLINPELGTEREIGWGGVGPRLVLAVSAVVHVESDQFIEMASKAPTSPVVVASTGLFRRQLRYLASRHQMMFTTNARAPLKFPPDVQLIAARKIWIP
jgi:hypothetical protein